MDEILKMFGGAENIWNAIQENAAKVGIEVTRTMLELFYVLKSPNTGKIDKTLIVAALGYQLLPEDALPRDKYGFLGFLDNGVTLAFAYNRVKSSVTPEIEHQVNNILSNWFGTATQSEAADIPENNGNQFGGYTSQPINVEQQPQGYKPMGDCESHSQPFQKPQKPIWNDDDDVVID